MNKDKIFASTLYQVAKIIKIETNSSFYSFIYERVK